MYICIHTHMWIYMCVCIHTFLFEWLQFQMWHVLLQPWEWAALITAGPVAGVKEHDPTYLAVVGIGDWQKNEIGWYLSHGNHSLEQFKATAFCENLWEKLIVFLKCLPFPKIVKTLFIYTYQVAAVRYNDWSHVMCFPLNRTRHQQQNQHGLTIPSDWC